MGEGDNRKRKKLRGFILATFEMVSNPLNSNVIRFSPNGLVIEIVSTARFEQEVLPAKFRHSNVNSFARQLNMHGFKACSCSEGVERAYFHKLFRRGMDTYWLQQIKRKPVPSKKESEEEHASKLVQWKNQTQASIEEWERLQNAAAAAAAAPPPPAAPSPPHPSISEVLLDAAWEHAVKRFSEDQDNDVSHFLLSFPSSILSSPLPSTNNNSSSSDEGGDK